MSGYGKVISGGAQVQKVGGGAINKKLSAFADGHGRSEQIANAVNKAFTVKLLSDQATNNVSAGGKFKKVTPPSKV
jgi:hypothetical protein